MSRDLGRNIDDVIMPTQEDPLAVVAAWLHVDPAFRSRLQPVRRHNAATGDDGADDSADRGLVAQVDLAVGDEVLAVPLARLVTPAVVATGTAWGRAVHAAASALTAIQWLVLFLAVARDPAAPAVDDLRAAWGPYLATLPATFAGCPDHSQYPADLLAVAGALHPAAVEHVVGRLRRVRAADEAAVRGALAAAAPRLGCPGYSPPATVLEWAWWAVNTRCISCNMPDGGGDAVRRATGIPAGIALAPYLDLLNHSADVQTAPVVDRERGIFVLHALQPVRVGDEFFISYGPHDNGQLWIEYGFVIADHPHEQVNAMPALERLVRPPDRSAAGSDKDAPTSPLLAARQAAWARVQQLGLARNLGWSAVDGGEPTWALWRTACALAWAEVAATAAVAVGGRLAARAAVRSPPSAVDLSKDEAMAAFLLGSTDNVPASVAARARATLHAMASFLLKGLDAGAAAARALPAADDPRVADLWRWHDA